MGTRMASVIEPRLERELRQGRFVPSAATRLLVVAPHPDDETIANGELIQHVVAAGGQVAVLLLTDGDNNPWPQRWIERRVWIGAAERQRWGRRRRHEVTEALRRLGAEPDALHPLGWPDMGVTDGLRRDPEAMIGVLCDWLRAFDPDTVALPSLHDHHPDHGSAHVATRLAVHRWGGAPRLLGYMVHGHAGSPAATVALKASPMQRRTKLDALDAHASQMALSPGRMRRMSMRREHYEVVELAGPGAPCLPWRPPSACWPWLRLTVVGEQGARSWPLRKAPLRRDREGRLHLQMPQLVSPAFARLESVLHSPWIFDHWGWCELQDRSVRPCTAALTG